MLTTAQTTATHARQLCVMFLLELSTVGARAQTRADFIKLVTSPEPLRVNTQTYGEMEARLKQNKIHQLLLS